MRRLLQLLLLITFALPAHAAENEIILGATVAGRYDSNVNNRLSYDIKPTLPGYSNLSEVQSGGIDVGPRLTIRSAGDQWNVAVLYKPLYTWNSAKNVENEWRQYVSGKVGWQVSPATSIVARDYLRYENNATLAEYDAEENTVDYDDQYVLLNRANLEINHQLSERSALQARFSDKLVRNESDFRSDSQTIAGAIDADYAFTQKLRLGGGFRTSYVSVDSAAATNQQVLPGSTSTYITGYGLIRYQFSPHLSTNLSIGPTYVITELQGEASAEDIDNEWTFFAQGGIEYETERWKLGANYRRSEDTNPRSNLTQTIDAISANVEYRPHRDWVLAMRGGWNRRESTGRDSLNLQQDMDQGRFAATASYRFHPKFTAHLTFDYLHQSEVQDRFDSLSGVIYNFDGDGDRFRLFLRIDWDGKAFRF